MKIPPSLAYLISGLIIILDQFTKLLVEQTFSQGQSIRIVESMEFLRLTYVTNTGAAWGLFRGYSTLLVFFAVLVTVVCIGIIQTSTGVLVRFVASCILGGGVGNLLDRLFGSAGVVDFIDVGVYSYRWPVFNVADSFLTLGMIILLVGVFHGELLGDERQDRRSGDTNE